MRTFLLMWMLAGIFLIVVITGIRSMLWKVIWLAAGGSLWYFIGSFAAAPLMILVIVGVATLQSREIKAKSDRPEDVVSQSTTRV
jgi:hypothetical protein